jgi:ribonuclease HI
VWTFLKSEGIFFSEPTVIMDPTIVLAQLSTLVTREPDNVLAQLTSRWIASEAAHGRGDQAANDPLIADIVSRARLATDCGWTPHINTISSPRCVYRHTFEPDLIIYCDGSCTNNGKSDARAGYGIYISKNNAVLHTHSARVPSGEAQTNQRAELLAIQYALNYVGDSGHTATIYTDSKYAMDCLIKWAPTWEKAGWKKADKKPILHIDIIQPTIELLRMIQDRVHIQHVVGHSGSLGNDEADRLARAGTLLP